MELTDGVVRLRPPRDGDAAELTRAVRESLDALVRWMPWASADYDEERAREWVRGVRGGNEHGFLIVEPGGAIAGSCGLNQLDALNNSANLGYWCRSGHTGKGYVTRAARLVTRFGHAEVGLHHVKIVVAVGNDRSRRVAERLGAHLDGVLRAALRLQGEYHDAYRYSLLPGELDSVPSRP
jgi:RimJ/RimL family protein N-acetyltransferase